MAASQTDDSPVAPRGGGSPASDRLPLVDALRGFALFGILVVNLQFFAYPLGADPSQFGATPLDTAATWLTRALFESKFYVLFSFLFGFGFHVQIARGAHGARTPRARYLRRIAGLFVLGVLHATLLFVGDILASYALLGLALWLTRGWQDWRLERTALGLLAMACLLGALVGSRFAVAPEPSMEVFELTIAQPAAAYRGTFTTAVGQRLEELPLMYLFAPVFTWPTALAMFLLGVVAGRTGLLANAERLHALFRRHGPLIITVALLGNAFYATVAHGIEVPLLAALAFGAIPILGPLLALLYAWALAELVERRPDSQWGRTLRSAGRLSLTNYLAQSIVCGAIFNGWGLGLYARVSPATLLAIAIAVYAAQLVFSRVWLRFFAIGPAECLLRAFTNLRRC